MQGWGKSGKRGRFCLDPISEGDEEDTFSVPDSLPDLIDSAGEEERPSPVGLAEKGVVSPGLVLYQDSVRPNRFWLR